MIDVTHNLILVFFLVGYFFTLIISPGTIKFLNSAEVVAENYQGNSIPKLGGMCFLFGFLVSLVFLQLFFNLTMEYYLLTGGIAFMAFLGLLDDLLGNREVSGLRGHFRSLLSGNITTGAIKAIGGAVIALLIAIPMSASIQEVILNWLIISLAINAINLLDLRPGRAIKGFLLITLLVFLAGLFNLEGGLFPALGLIVGAVIAYMPYDLKGKAMMGDVGSNVLGIAAGAFVVVFFPLAAKIITLLGLITLHVYTERRSLSVLIEKVNFLKLIDNLGR